MHMTYVLNVFRQCGIRDPSWTELRNFIGFLDVQLKASEKSIFCNEAIVGDVMSGFKTFVVRFMIRMSKVYYSFICPHGSLNTCTI